MSSVTQQQSQPVAIQGPSRVPEAGAASIRPFASGKFLFIGGEKLHVRGVTYGAFRPDPDGNQYPGPIVVERDFAQMAAHGLNAIRVYTAPPRWLLDAAQRHGLRVMIGLSAELYVGSLIDKKLDGSDVEAAVRAKVRACVGHPAVLCYAVGNEIPASIVRWLGPRWVERYLERLCGVVRDEDPDGLVTYVNYPSTEYLRLPFADLACFNVYLERQDCLEAYLARLQNVVGDRPLIMSEIGLDSRRHGEDAQARALDWGVRMAFAAGCAGAFVFAWTDQWYAGGAEVEDWDFGLTDRARRRKPALAAASRAFAEAPFPADRPWPRISVVVCSHNGARTIRDTFEGLLGLEYPNYEVIVVDDGSTDATAAMGIEYDFRVISTENRGLSSARNIGLAQATGEIVAYTDDDAYPDRHWLQYLADTFMRTTHVGVGGPNIPPPDDGLIARCVANAPGGPTHVLLTDTEAEHIPGCNMAFRKDALEAIGGFDPQFRAAGDDVDLCWRLQERGWTLGFNPAAVVWHHRRDSVRAYWKQQVGYGKAEALLERKWHEKYNATGHISWAGRLYGHGLLQALGSGPGRIYHGIWGSAPFQSLYQPASGILRSLPLMPEWYLIVTALAALSALGVLWAPLLFTLPALALALGASLALAGLGAARASFGSLSRSPVARLKLRGLTAFLYLVQPLARLSGRLRHGLHPWGRRGAQGLALPWPSASAVWSERWRRADEWLSSAEVALRAAGARVCRGGTYDRWDLEVQTGVFGAARMCLAVEEHPGRRQLLRFRTWPRCSASGLVLALSFAALSAEATLDRAWGAAALLAAVAALVVMVMLLDCAAAAALVRRGVQLPHATAESWLLRTLERVEAESGR